MNVLGKAIIAAAGLLGASCSASGDEDGSSLGRGGIPTSPAAPTVEGSTPNLPTAPSNGDTGGIDIGSLDGNGGAAQGEDIDNDGDTDATCGQQEFVIERRPAEVLLVLDRSGSMQDPPEGTTITDSKWNVTLPALNQVIQATDADVSWGLKVFPEGTGNLCQATSVTGNVVAPVAPANAATVVGSINSQIPEGDGTPTGAAIYTAVEYMNSRQSTNPNQYILLATDGEPSCAALPSSEGQEAARPYAVEAVTAAAAAGYPVFVVGVNTTKDTAVTVLNQLASAGGVARADPNPLATRFYLGSTTDELVTAFQQVTGQIASCTFTLAEPPPVPENIGVRVNERLLPNDPNQSEGWAYTAPDFTAVEVFGSSCDEIRSLPSNAVRIVFGCPGVPIVE